eukprot:654684-Hanusia_phi.AAC.1
MPGVTVTVRHCHGAGHTDRRSGRGATVSASLALTGFISRSESTAGVSAAIWYGHQFAESGTVRPAAPGTGTARQPSPGGTAAASRTRPGPQLPGPPRRAASEPAEASDFRIMLKPAASSEFNRRLVADSDSG